jgi:[ribosomal protein S5]-alanine N-acetyltransferase
LIRPLVLEDAAEVARLLTANRSFLAPFEPEHADDFFTAEGQHARIEAADHLYAILDGGALAGVISLSNVVRGPFQSAHLGYWVGETSCGRGLATRALAELADRSFTELGLHRLEAATLVDNVASQRVLEKNRFVRIGVAPRYLRIAGAWSDHVLFQRTVED